MQGSTTIISDLKAEIIKRNRDLIVSIKSDERVPAETADATVEFQEHLIDYILTGVNIQRAQELGIERSARVLNSQFLQAMEAVLSVLIK
jgi:hypothetical protein